MTHQLTAVLTPRMLRLRRLVIREVGRFPELARTVYDNGPQRAIERLTRLLKAATAAGVIDLDDPRQAATQLNWVGHGRPRQPGMFLGDRAVPNPEDLRNHVVSAVDTFLGRLRLEG